MIIQRITVGGCNRYMRLNIPVSVAPVPVTGGELEVTARLLQGLDDADLSNREITAREVGDPEINKFLVRLQFEKHLVGYDPNEVSWLAWSLVSSRMSPPRGDCGLARSAWPAFSSAALCFVRGWF